MSPAFKRILLKISGEALVGKKGFGIDPDTLDQISGEIIDIHKTGLQLGLVLGGGNIFRGMSEAGQTGLERVTADQMGMLATVINSLAMQDALEKKGVPTRVMSAIKMDQIAEPFIKRRAVRHLEKGRIIILACGTGNPYFTTDTAGVLRAIEIKADAIFKATKVDGVYDRDPARDDKAVRFDTLHYDDILTRHLKVMDATAITLCAENRLPLMVFNLTRPGNLLRAARGEKVGTLVQG